MQGSIKLSNRYVGIKQSKRAIESGRAVKAFIAEDCADDIRQGLELLCQNNNVPIEYVPTMKQLGAECGIDVGSAIAVMT